MASASLCPEGYRWIFFDLFDTLCLVDEGTYFEAKEESAKAAGVSLDTFMKAWRSTSEESSRGWIRTPFDRAVTTLAYLGIEDRMLASGIASVEIEALQECVGFYDGATEALDRFRERGFSLGLISNATPTTAFLVSRLHLRERLDRLTFSFQAGAMKPEPAIYEAALRGIEAPPDHCLFVADGASGELDGATEAGLGTVWMDHPVKATRLRGEGPSPASDHPRVADFGELLSLTELQAPRDFPP